MSSEPAPEQTKPARSNRGARVGSCLRHQSPIANGHIKHLLNAAFHADPRALEEEVMSAQRVCLASPETAAANRAWTERREVAFW